MDASVERKEPPVPRPRTAVSNSRIPTAIRRKPVTNVQDETRESFLHVAEVHSAHSSKSDVRETVSTSDERSVEPIEGKKRKKVVRKRSTFVVKKSQTVEEDDGNGGLFKKPFPFPVERKRGSATETLSDNSSPTRIQIGPLVDRSRRRRQPQGSATETLSEDSSPAHHPLPTPDLSPRRDPTPVPPVPPPRSSVSSNRLSPGPRSDLSPKPGPASAPDSPSCYTSSSVDYQDTGVMPSSKQKKSKKRRKLKEDKEIHDEPPSEEPPKPPRQATCLTIHRCEPLKMRDMYKRPSVRVHFFDTKTQKVRTSAEGKMDVETLETRPFDPILQRTLVPTWNEELLLNEPPSNIASPECLLIFELLEMETNDLIAWAFLRPVAANRKSNLEKLLRLQLYKVASSKKLDSSLPKPFQWWIKGKLKPYRSTLFVSIHPVPAELLRKTEVNGGVPSLLMRKNSNLSRKISMKTRSMSEEKPKVTEADLDLMNATWSRLPSLSCKLPNKIDKQASAGSEGGICLAYSHSGLLLACHASSSLTVFTYRGTPYLILNGHYGLVYGISWSSDDSLLCTASADTTACIWDVKSKLATPVLKLPHPSYVYCCTWIGQNRVVTGCFDGGVRLWHCFTGGPLSYACDPPIEDCHKTRVNSLALLLKSYSGNSENACGEHLVTGDSEGILIFWKLSEDETNDPKSLELSRIVKLRELKQKNINKITCHPGGKRILVATRDNTLRMIDLKTTAVIQWFHGGVSQKLHFGSGSTFCGCGSRVLACSEDGRVLVWDANTGERLACYNQTAVQAIDFHPMENSFALLGYSVGCFPSVIIASHARGETAGGDFILQWSADYKNSTDCELKSRSASSRHKKLSMLTTLLQHHTSGFNSNKKSKKGVTNGAYADTETPSEKHRMKNASPAEPLGGAIDNRLSEVIRKMDSILFENHSDFGSTSRISTPASTN